MELYINMFPFFSYILWEDKLSIASISTVWDNCAYYFDRE